MKILEINYNPNDAMSFYRSRGPFQALSKKYRDIDFTTITNCNNCNWDFINTFDAVFILRPYTEQHLEMIMACKQFGIPTWIDFDDLLTDVPMDNPAYITYESITIKRIIHFILENCTVCTFATNYLMQTMGKSILHKSFVVPNAHNPKILNKPACFENHKKVVWRGSATHARDLQQFQGPIREVMRTSQQKGSEWQMEFIGMNPIEITDYVDSIYSPYIQKNKYFEYLSEVKGSILIVPLSHRPAELNFNKSKSNIAWLEFTYGGLVCLAPSWEEWKKPGVINYENQKDFANKLTAMIEGKYDLKSLHQQSWQYIQENLTLDIVNEKRYQIISQHLMFG